MATDHAGALIGKPRRSDPSPAVLRVSTPDDEPKKRREAVWTLGLTGTAGIPALTEALQDDDVEVRREAVWALGRIGTVAVVPALSGALDDNDDEVRGLAADIVEAVRRTSASSP
jgi:HEAT repeat protein